MLAVDISKSLFFVARCLVLNMINFIAMLCRWVIRAYGGRQWRVLKTLKWDLKMKFYSASQ